MGREKESKHNMLKILMVIFPLLLFANISEAFYVGLNQREELILGMPFKSISSNIELDLKYSYNGWASSYANKLAEKSEYIKGQLTCHYSVLNIENLYFYIGPGFFADYSVKYTRIGALQEKYSPESKVVSNKIIIDIQPEFNINKHLSVFVSSCLFQFGSIHEYVTDQKITQIDFSLFSNISIGAKIYF